MGFSFRKPKHKPATAEFLADMTQYAEFKQLVYSISALQRQKGFHSLAILSSFDGEGKTLFCAALALGYAEASQSRVLVVDTTSFHRPKSLILKQCLNPAQPMVDFLPLEKGKIATTRATRRPGDGSESAEKVPGATIYGEPDPGMSLASFKEETDQSLIRQVAEEASKQYGLVLLDTVPLSAKNKNNIDPLLVAHLADASVLVVSQKLLNSANLAASLKVFEDPSLHLIGIVSNEEHAP